MISLEKFESKIKKKKTEIDSRTEQNLKEAERENRISAESNEAVEAVNWQKP